MDNNPVQGQLFAQPGESIASIMGILDDGTPYLTMALSKICGLDPSTMWAFTANWNCTDDKPRTKFICDRLFAQGYDTSSLFSRISRQGQIVHAYPDYVCMAILEYYAFEAKRFDNTIARDNYRKLASYTLRRAIYESLGINSGSTPAIAKSWQVYQERILLNDQIPVTHFSIFREMADVLVRLINSQFKLDPYSVPDISVGQHWGKYWQASNLEQTFGPRIKHPHYYPDSFPQSGAGAVPAWIYPVEALGLFRKWLMTTYVNDKLEPYLNKKVQQGALPEIEKTQILHAISSNTKYLN